MRMAARKTAPVTLNLFQGPPDGLGLAARWMLKQVQHDGVVCAPSPSARISQGRHN
jgi:hypothetical protein